MRDAPSEYVEADGVALPSTTLDAVPALVYHLDFDGRLRWWNRGFAEATGYDDAELDGMNVRDLLVEADHDQARAARAAVREGGEWRGELRLRTKTGETVVHHHDIAATGEPPRGVTGVAREVGRHDDADRLDTYRQVVETVGDTVDALVAAGSRAEIEQALCRRLTNSGLYRGVWVGHLDADGTIAPTTTVGPATGSIEALRDLYDELGEDPPAQTAVETGETQVVQYIPTSELPAPVREFAADHGVVAGAAIPIGGDGLVHSTLVVYTDRANAFDEVELDALEQLGRVAGITIGAARTERLVISEPSVELEFRQTGEEVPLSVLARETGAEGHMERMTQNDDGDVVEYFTITGAPSERVIEEWEQADNVRSCRLVDPEASLYEVTFSRSAVGTLLEAGAEIQEIGTGGEAAVVTATAPPGTDIRGVLDRIQSIYPETRLVAKRTLGDPSGPDEGWAEETVLTDRQLDVLAAAFEAGYFEWPRDATAEEVAERLDISAATLHYHLRRAERSIVEAYLDGHR
ncbi:bacterio-opsin activator domain-containing protein [Halosegnis sp.]|uniref:bacterio-opsin activator domain-containing protein n=1 Tax=Halosegnis sp. TaxID=2864959 RepID=UPI0035D50AC3